MRTPYIREYAASLEACEQTFAQAPKLSLIKTANGGLDYFCGGQAVLFGAIADGGKNVVVKCYRKEDARRGELWRALKRRDLTPYGVVGDYFEQGLTLVCDNPCYADVLITPRLEGVTLDIAVAELCRQGDRVALARLAEEFDRMAEWLLAQDWAHGDIKPENIVVCDDGLRLIDFDAAFIAEVKAPRSEGGSTEYNHPLRTVEMDDKHLDDWPLAIISINLHALSLNPLLMSAMELPLTAHFFEQESAALKTLCKEFAQAGKARARALCRVLCGSSYKVNGLPEIFAHHTCATRGEMFNIGSLWGLRYDGQIVEPAVWDDIICQNGHFFGFLDGKIFCFSEKNN